MDRFSLGTEDGRPQPGSEAASAVPFRLQCNWFGSRSSDLENVVGALLPNANYVHLMPKPTLVQVER